MKDTSWGGQVEVQILSQIYKVEICVVSIEFNYPYYFGQGQNYNKRIYLLYDGIHYDVIVRAIAKDMPEQYDVL